MNLPYAQETCVFTDKSFSELPLKRANSGPSRPLCPYCGQATRPEHSMLNVING